jgi:HK97 family phage portal protein
VHTTAGLRVSADGALQLSAVFACVRIIASQFASLPFTLYRNRLDGGKDRVTDHPVYRLLARKPNPYQNAFEWREMMAGHLALRGNAYNQIVTDGRGNITGLIPLHPDRVQILLQTNGDYGYRYTQPNGAIVTYSRGEIWHLRGLSSDGVIGLSPIALARNALGGAMAAQDYGARFFANDATPTGGWIEYPGSFKDKQAREQFRESLQEAQSGINHGKLAVFEFGMKYHQISVTPEDAQFLETRRFQVTDIARWFGVPPHKIGDLDRATNNNIEQQALEFVQETLGPMAERWEASIEAELLFDDEELEAEFQFSQLMRGDSQSRATFYNMGIQSGWLTRNEARIAENLNPLPGLDAPLRPLNMAEEGANPLPPQNADTP